jgi:anti-anti-sigma regulatory factor
MKDANLEPIDLASPVWRDDPHMLKAELEARLEVGIVVDASVSRPIDTLSLQLLLAAKNTALTIGREFLIKNMSPEFEQGLHQVGLFEELMGKGA